MKHVMQRVIVLSALAGVATVLLATASPGPARATPASVADEWNANLYDRVHSRELASCELYKAREMCCPIWTAGKDKHLWEAAKALNQCAKAYGCTDWGDSPSNARYQCGG